MIKLYHYSQNDFKGYIKPDFFGSNTYSNSSVKLSGVKRSYFYLNPNKKEWFFNGSRFLYTTEINEKNIYNLNEDKLKLYNLNLSISDFLTRIKNKGYIGFYDNAGLEIVCLFKAVKIKTKTTLTRV